jgi:hypothetical protein
LRLSLCQPWIIPSNHCEILIETERLVRAVLTCPKRLGAGGGRPSSTSMADISNGVLYGVFTFSAMGASTVLNTIGPRPTLMFAVSGYPLYTGKLNMTNGIICTIILTSKRKARFGTLTRTAISGSRYLLAHT